jgi:hypothetical protein
MPKKFSDDDIRQAMLKAHRESYEIWWRLVISAGEKEKVRALYRYREGFDHALINLARKLGVDLSATPAKDAQQKPKTKETEALLEHGKTPVCSQCTQLLFKVSKKVWYCPQCKMDYLFGED